MDRLKDEYGLASQQRRETASQLERRRGPKRPTAALQWARGRIRRKRDRPQSRAAAKEGVIRG